jgi:hypothetical protein
MTGQLQRNAAPSQKYASEAARRQEIVGVQEIALSTKVGLSSFAPVSSVLHKRLRSLARVSKTSVMNTATAKVKAEIRVRMVFLPV